MRPQPRSTRGEVHLWSLDGLFGQQLLAKRPVMNGHSYEGVDVVAIEYFEPLDAVIVFQSPATAHLFASRDLQPLLDPAFLHSRRISCLASCICRSEIIIATVDGRLIIFTLTSERVLRKTDPSACTARSVLEHRVRSRLAWSIGTAASQVACLIVDENLHGAGVRAFAAIDNSVHAWSWDTGASLLRLSSCHAARISSLELRHDSPQLFTAARDGAIRIWSLREASQGRLLESFDGHPSPIASLRLDPARRVLYSMDEAAGVRCWDVATGADVARLELGEPAGSAGVEEDQEASPWRHNEVLPSRCRMNLADLPDGRSFLLCRSRDAYVVVAQRDARNKHAACSGETGMTSGFDESSLGR